MMTLYGDPEMRVWTLAPRALKVDFTYIVADNHTREAMESIQILATDAGVPVGGLEVQLTQG